MEISHFCEDTCPPTNVVLQVLRLSCPCCHEPVRFVVHEDDKQYRPEAEHYKKVCHRQQAEIHRLQRIIDKLANYESLIGE